MLLYIDKLEGLIYYFKNCRETRFTSAMISSKEIATKMKIEHAFHEKCIIRRKKQFDENANGKFFRIDYFLYMVDQAISSIQSRFEQFQIYENKFDFLFNFKKLNSLDDDGL